MTIPNDALYGVWLPGEGWYKFKGDPIVGDAELASSLREIIGGYVSRIDNAMVAAEVDLLARDTKRRAVLYAPFDTPPPWWKFWRKR